LADSGVALPGACTPRVPGFPESAVVSLGDGLRRLGPSVETHEKETTVAAEVLFARYASKTLEPKNSFGAKWIRLLERINLAATVSGKRVAIKIHLGGGTGFTTVHPFLVRKLVDKVRQAGAREVFLTDSPGAVRNAAERGYTAETVGCPLAPVSGTADKYFYKKPVDPAFRHLAEVELAGEIVDADALIDLSHLKGHGDCGFGGASKNLSMGCVTGRTRGQLHALEGGLEWNGSKCTHCKVCMENCPNGSIRFNQQGELSVFYHNCKFCQHCVLICPEKALTMVGGRYKDFQRGMALATSHVLKTFAPANCLFINVLTNITIFCDCWGMSTPSLVPDIGVVAGSDIVAVEQASLDLIRTEDLIPGALPPSYQLGDTGHLFERIHRKSPHVVLEYLTELGHGRSEYTLVEVE
jgi:uncharacterized protein